MKIRVPVYSFGKGACVLFGPPDWPLQPHRSTETAFLPAKIRKNYTDPQEALLSLAEPYRKREPHPFFIAHRIKPISYVSLHSALAFIVLRKSRRKFSVSQSENQSSFRRKSPSRPALSSCPFWQLELGLLEKSKPGKDRAFEWGRLEGVCLESRLWQILWIKTGYPGRLSR